MNNYIYLLSKLTYMLVYIVVLSSCGQKSTYGLTNLPKFQQIELKDVNIDKKIIPDDKFVEAIKIHTDRLVKERKKQLILDNNKKTVEQLELKSKRKVISNLKKLGVINITARLKGPQAKINNNLINKLDDRQVFIKRIDGNKDRFGGKIICNTEVLTHRIDRTNFIQCLKNQDKLEKLSLFNFFVNRNLTSLSDVKPEDVKQECKVTYAVSLHSYHELTECLIHDFEKGGFFKFRNTNSLGAKFNIL